MLQKCRINQKMYASSVNYTIKMIYMIWDKKDMVHSIVHKLANLCNEHYILFNSVHFGSTLSASKNLKLMAFKTQPSSILCLQHGTDNKLYYE